jgi:hypothetical protein
VNKRKGEAYKLIWKKDTDFVRMAAKLDAIIVPFAALGADDAYDVRTSWPSVVLVSCGSVTFNLQYVEVEIYEET